MKIQMDIDIAKYTLVDRELKDVKTLNPGDFHYHQ